MNDLNQNQSKNRKKKAADCENSVDRQKKQNSKKGENRTEESGSNK